MRARTVLYALLLVVAGAAAVLSFAALRDLALICGFAPWLAWLLPVVVDAGAAAGSLVWLGGPTAASARRFARALALALLGLSVAANALGHGLAAFAISPPWWVVVAVSAIAPAVLGAVVHLAVLVGRPHEPTPDAPALWPDDEPTHVDPVDAGLVDEHGLSRLWETTPFAEHGSQHRDEHADGPDAEQDDEDGGAQYGEQDRVAALIAEGAGRRRLSRELDISEYEARRLLDRTRQTNGAASGVHLLNGSGDLS